MNTEKLATPQDCFEDAEHLFEAALKQMKGDIRDAAEKAWGATVNATKGLVATRIGTVPETSTRTRNQFDKLVVKDDKLKSLGEKYLARQQLLHGDCFYDGMCEPRELVERAINETREFIDQARRLAYQRS